MSTIERLDDARQDALTLADTNPERFARLVVALHLPLAAGRAIDALAARLRARRKIEQLDQLLAIRPPQQPARRRRQGTL